MQDCLCGNIVDLKREATKFQVSVLSLQHIIIIITKQGSLFFKYSVESAGFTMKYSSYFMNVFMLVCPHSVLLVDLFRQTFVYNKDMVSESCLFVSRQKSPLSSMLHEIHVDNHFS